MLYGTLKWDPALIIAQITFIQLAGYAVWALLLLATLGPFHGGVFGAPTAWLFDARSMSLSYPAYGNVVGGAPRGLRGWTSAAAGGPDLSTHAGAESHWPRDLVASGCTGVTGDGGGAGVAKGDESAWGRGGVEQGAGSRARVLSAPGEERWLALDPSDGCGTSEATSSHRGLVAATVRRLRGAGSHRLAEGAGWSLSLAWGLAAVGVTHALALAGVVAVTVRRAKRCLDFTATFYLIHFVICCIYGGFPTAGLWWASTLVSLVACALVSEFACMRWEMAEIPLAGLTASRPAATTAAHAPGIDADPGAATRAHPSAFPGKAWFARATGITGGSSRQRSSTPRRNAGSPRAREGADVEAGPATQDAEHRPLLPRAAAPSSSPDRLAPGAPRPSGPRGASLLGTRAETRAEGRSAAARGAAAVELSRVGA